MGDIIRHQTECETMDWKQACAHEKATGEETSTVRAARYCIKVTGHDYARRNGGNTNKSYTYVTMK